MGGIGVKSFLLTNAPIFLMKDKGSKALKKYPFSLQHEFALRGGFFKAIGRLCKGLRRCQAYNMKDKKIKAVGYIKAPTGRIKEINPNPGVQEEEIKVYAESEGLDLVRVYREKVLGGNIVNKDELDQIYKDISEGNADTILIYKGDRVTRRWSINRVNKEEHKGDSEEI